MRAAGYGGRATAIREPSVHDPGQPNYGRPEEPSGELYRCGIARRRGGHAHAGRQRVQGYRRPNNLNVPDALKDIQKEYVDGTADLKDALNSYIDLYTEIDSATEEQPFDYSTYDQRIQDIKSKYDEGIGKLQSGDNKASELPE